MLIFGSSFKKRKFCSKRARISFKPSRLLSAWELANGESGSTYALNSYAMAGYIAGSIFVQALQAVDKAGLELNYANFAKIMEETEFSIPMGGTISYAGGDRLGVTALALNCVSLSKNDAGVYALTPVSPILSLADVVAATKRQQLKEDVQFIATRMQQNRELLAKLQKQKATSSPKLISP